MGYFKKITIYDPILMKFFEKNINITSTLLKRNKYIEQAKVNCHFYLKYFYFNLKIKTKGL
jgi:hypothetical protein